VKASFQSLLGQIVSEWEIGGGKLAWRVTVPPNATATAYVPATDPAQVMESGKPAAKAQGVRFLPRSEPRAAVFELQSGSYRFEAPWS
jgi:alpha-L-rhamnosidase